MTTPGTVYLVGAGPGDPDLISLRAVEVLSRADIVLYDYLVNPVVLQHVRADAACICLGRHGRGSLWPAEKIQARLVDEALRGRQVVRLKGGDPMVFGRAAGELRSLRDAGIPFEIVPGVTAGLAAAAYAGIPFTDRDTASAVAFVTGQQRSDKDAGPCIDFDALAQFPGTLVMYMGVTTAARWTKQLIDAGMPPQRRVALVRRCSWPDQQVILCRLDEVAAHVTPYSKFPPPVVALIGDAAADHYDWFHNRPLSGHTVLVTRPRAQAARLADHLRELGAHVVAQPSIEIHAAPSKPVLDESIAKIDEFDVVVFSSGNGVRAFMDRVMQLADARKLASVQLAVVGASTAAALGDYHLKADFVPEDQFGADRLLELLIRDAAGRRYLIVRGTRGRDRLVDGLRGAGAAATEVVVYATRDVTENTPEVTELLQQGGLDWVLVTSPAVGRATAKLLGGQAQANWLAISAATAAALREVGVEVTAVADEASDAALVQLLVSIVHSGG